MKLLELMAGIEYSGSADGDAEIKTVVSDSRRVIAGAAFVCMQGKHFDGHDAAAKALEAGAVVVISERPLGLPSELVVSNTRTAYATMCQNYFDNPQKKLTLIAITGTNGKTTVSTVMKQALTNLGHKTGLIGTIQVEIGDMKIPARFTTPEPWELYALFSRMLMAGCTHVVMEASSQALDQGRLAGLQFACSVFTNLTQDHLDYHGTMEAYYEAKRSLFDQTDIAVINIDDAYGARLAEELVTPKITLSVKDDSADYTAKSVDYSLAGVRFSINGTGFIDKVSFPMPGRYSVDNAMCVLCALFAIGLDRNAVCKAVSKAKGVKGRCEVLYSGEYTIICDYAHTSDGLEQLLSSLKPFVKNRLIVLFGCGGDRDAKKRPKMAAAVMKYADFIVLTSDNPRTEDPLSIINEVSVYMREGDVPFTAHPDRTYAIDWAIHSLEADDVLVLCGKGHENYQVIDGCTIYFDEHRIVNDIIQNM